MTSEQETTKHYDYIVLGGGSGGIASAKRAAIQHSKKVLVIEKARWGGTCVNVGCVPKKIMFMAATMADTLNHDVQEYGFSALKQDGEKVKVDWPKLKEKRDEYIVKLNTIYESGLNKAGIDVMVGDGTFIDSQTIQVTSPDGTTTQTVTGSHILIATGGRPVTPEGEGVAEHSITSDGFFELSQLPQVVVVVGAGYIAVELAGVLNSLGAETHLVLRKDKALRTFDPDIANELDHAMMQQGIHIHRHTTNGVAKISTTSDGNKKMVQLHNGDTIYGVETVLMAAGRVPNVETLSLDKVGVTLTDKGYIAVDEYQNTIKSNNNNIYALGDVCGTVQLTPMAIAAGRRLADRLFGTFLEGRQQQKPKVSYENVPTVVFSHPTIGTIGMTEPQAMEKYGKEHVKVYKSRFTNMYYGIFDMESDDKPKTLMKLITVGMKEQVVGLHIIGMGADEMLQGFGVAIKMGATKADFDSVIAIHPTAAEELVTMGTWGTSPQETGAQQSPLFGASPPEPPIVTLSSAL